MKRITFYVRVLLLVTILALVLSTAAFADVGDDPINPLEIQVSPHTLNLASNGGSFTIHADVPFDSVTVVNLAVGDLSLTVNHPGPVVGEEAEPTDCYTFADDLGDLVVKCDLETVKGMVAEGEATFVLVVDAPDDMNLTGEDTIDVIDHGQNGNGNSGNGPGDGECDGPGDGECDGSGDGECDGSGDGECDGSGGGHRGH